MCTKIMTRQLKFPTIHQTPNNDKPDKPTVSDSSLETSISSSTVPRHTVSQVAQSLVQALVQRDINLRLCCGKNPDQPNCGIASLQRHPFFTDIDWHLMSNNDPKQDGCNYIIPPYIPNFGKDPDDTRNFDRDFTKMTVKDSPPGNDQTIVSVSGS
jgi:Protein kinase C terminal domain